MKLGRISRFVAVMPREGAVDLVEVISRNGQPTTGHTATIAMTPGTDPGPLGEALARALAAAGISRGRAVLCVPQSWCALAPIDMPELSRKDRKEFLALQCETHLTAGSDEVALAVSEYVGPGPERSALLIATPLARIREWKQALKLAHLDTVACVPAMLSGAGNPEAVEALLAMRQGLALLQITVNGSLAAWRDLGLGRSRPTCRDDMLVELPRELRLAMAELPEKLSRAVTHVRAVVDPGCIDLLNHLRPLETSPECQPRLTITPNPTAIHVLVAHAALENLTSARSIIFEDPKARDTVNHGRRRILTIMAVAAGLALVAEGGFILQQTRELGKLRRTEQEMAPAVAQAEMLRDRLRELRPWYDQTPATLRVLRDLAAAFPQEGSIWATQVTVNDGTAVTLTGETTDTNGWLAMQRALRECPNVTDVAVSQTRASDGRASLSFSLRFTWNPTGLLP